MSKANGRIDKYDPISGGFRGVLAADVNEVDTPVGVGLDANGRVVVGVGNLPATKGVLQLTKDKKTGDPVDVMTDGELVDMTGLTAGTVITANNATGVLSTAAPSATQFEVGFTAEADRLIVRVKS